jgi:hypothetical protein
LFNEDCKEEISEVIPGISAFLTVPSINFNQLFSPSERYTVPSLNIPISPGLDV